MRTAESMAKWQRVRPIMTELLDAKGLREVGEGRVLVTGLEGPLEEDGRPRWTRSPTGSRPLTVSDAADVSASAVARCPGPLGVTRPWVPARRAAAPARSEVAGPGRWQPTPAT